ncbi:MAG: NAD(P)/FAD-dependent oxidoreductase [Desulfurococcales archaeon]|nr:NAD(P)/FAD-dependent oxidoreductase [Desulfurococcales archaeon]
MRIGVIGAGFAGLMFALSFAREGYSVDVFEEHGRVGYPPHCTGIVSSRTMELIGSPAKESLERRYRALWIGANGVYARVEPSGYVAKLDRELLEALMLEELESLGVRVSLGTRVSLVKPEGKIWVRGSPKAYDAVILADGFHGRIHKRLGIGYGGEKLLGLNAIARSRRGYDDIVVDFSERLSEGFFSWIVPVEGHVVIGTATRDPALLKVKMRALARKAGVEEFERVYGGPVLLGPPAERLYRGRVLVVGDAGGLVKPLTGGGLYPNALAASLASLMAKRGVDPAVAVRKALCRVSRELWAQYYVARAILENKGALEKAVLLSNITGLTGALKGSIDFDRHERIPAIGLSNPFRLAGVIAGLAILSPGMLGRAAELASGLAGSRRLKC